MENKLVFDKEAVVQVTKEFTFDSCHQLKEYNGKCARLHGHTYKLQVTLEGTVDDIGMVMDFKVLKELVEEFIIKDLDHYNLNDRLDFNTTAENMVVYFYSVIDACISGIKKPISLVEVKLWETPTSFATYRGE